MNYLIIGDMHGNNDALEAVLEHSSVAAIDEVLVLGDLIGYGATPNEIVEKVRSLPWPVHSIRGNHDKVAVGIDNGMNFNPTALLAARWTTEALTDDNLEFVRDLPQGPLEISDDLMICHGSVIDEDEYLLSGIDALDSFEAQESHVVFFGHTHIPSIFAFCDGHVEVAVLEGDDVTVEVQEGIRYLLNPGSVGQPRDRDPRASYMLFDSDRGIATLRRLEYPIEAAQEKIRRAGLPDILADRLAIGI